MATHEFKTHRVTELPEVLEAYAIYFVAPVAGNEEYVEIYVSSSDGASARRVMNEQDIQALIDAKDVGEGPSELFVYNTIAERGAPVPAKVVFAYVIDASSDSTVTSGGASYVFNPVSETWSKTSESESLDLVLNWDKIEGKPTSTSTAIDSAVTDSHKHGNKTELDKIGENVSGELTYGGVAVSSGVTQWTTTNW